MAITNSATYVCMASLVLLIVVRFVFVIAVAVGMVSRRWYMMIRAVLVLYSRMYPGVHYPSDVLPERK